MTTQNLVLVTGANGHLGNNLMRHVLYLFMLLSFGLSSIKPATAQSNTSPKVFVSTETDPAFWAGTASNGPAVDLNIDFRLAQAPRLRFGLLMYDGKWNGDLGKSILLTKDFTENNWATRWNGMGAEVQYQFRFGLKRGGLQPGLRMQWNQFIYYQDNIRKAEANQFALTPQVGFQYFPFKKLGFYILPWAGVQLPVAGTDKVMINGQERDSRKIIAVATAHLGWEFKF